jgi:hypothetical protein
MRILIAILTMPSSNLVELGLNGPAQAGFCGWQYSHCKAGLRQERSAMPSNLPGAITAL